MDIGATGWKQLRSSLGHWDWDEYDPKPGFARTPQDAFPLMTLEDDQFLKSEEAKHGLEGPSAYFPLVLIEVSPPDEAIPARERLIALVSAQRRIVLYYSRPTFDLFGRSAAARPSRVHGPSFVYWFHERDAQTQVKPSQTENDLLAHEPLLRQFMEVSSAVTSSIVSPSGKPSATEGRSIEVVARGWTLHEKGGPVLDAHAQQMMTIIKEARVRADVESGLLDELELLAYPVFLVDKSWSRTKAIPSDFLRSYPWLRLKLFPTTFDEMADLNLEHPYWIPSIELLDKDSPPKIFGRMLKKKLTASRFKMIKSLIDAGPNGLDQNAVTKIFSGGREMIYELRKQDSAWQNAILMPKDGSHYRVAPAW